MVNRMKLWLFILKRIIFAFITVIGLTFIVFFLSYVSGDSGGNEPVYLEYFYWLSSFFSGNLGYSNTPVYSGPVTTAILLFLPNTVMLTIIASILVWIIGIPLGVYSAVRRGSILDYSARGISSVLYSTPIYLIGIILIIVFGVELKILPISGNLNPLLASNLSWYKNGISYPTHIILIDALLHDDLPVFWDALLHTILPALTLALATIAGIIRILRSSMLEVLDQDYIKFARAKGVPEKVVINLHAKRNALIPVLTLYGYTIASLLSGTVVVESIFNYPGIGYWATQAILSGSMNGIMGATLIYGIVFVITSLILDIMYAIIDPRIRY